MELQNNVATEKKRRWSDVFVPPVCEDDSPSSNGDLEHEPDTDIPEETLPRRSLRRRFRNSLGERQSAELTKPKKLTEKSSAKDIENYYLDKRVKRLNPSLETIYEEPQQIRDEEVVMSTRKYRRVIDFKAITTKNSTKIKKRKMKAKLVTPNKHNSKVSLKFLMQKLEELSDE
ncbi:Tantalus domain containing protein [Asbolus verrucosus]|uniref:Tantalus domain containing protein n=1 Tax=Asbolus verrucosus TaxID=1661398 RepID=A0A482VZI3_ASBVE|nr:Tantalus domain containing protein [Asbolus verrucosus]